MSDDITADANQARASELIAAIFTDDLKTAARITAQGWDYEGQVKGFTPLEMAALEGSPAMVELIASHDPTTKHSMAIARCLRPEIMAVLAPRTNQAGLRAAFTNACNHDAAPVVQELLPYLSAKRLPAALVEAAGMGATAIVQLLIHHTDPKRNESLALRTAAFHGRIEVVRLLAAVADARVGGDPPPALRSALFKPPMMKIFIDQLGEEAAKAWEGMLASAATRRWHPEAGPFIAAWRAQRAVEQLLDPPAAPPAIDGAGIRRFFAASREVAVQMATAMAEHDDVATLQAFLDANVIGENKAFAGVLCTMLKGSKVRALAPAWLAQCRPEWLAPQVFAPLMSYDQYANVKHEAMPLLLEHGMDPFAVAPISWGEARDKWLSPLALALKAGDETLLAQWVPVPLSEVPPGYQATDGKSRFGPVRNLVELAVQSDAAMDRLPRVLDLGAPAVRRAFGLAAAAHFENLTNANWTLQLTYLQRALVHADLDAFEAGVAGHDSPASVLHWLAGHGRLSCAPAAIRNVVSQRPWWLEERASVGGLAGRPLAVAAHLREIANLQVLLALGADPHADHDQALFATTHQDVLALLSAAIAQRAVEATTAGAERTGLPARVAAP